jgi:hypothetical protein
MSLVQPTQPPAVLVAIDIAKLRHDVLIEAPGWKSRKRLILPNTAAEFRLFADFLHGLKHPVRVVFEATGNYHRPLAHFLQAEGFHLELIASLAVARTREAMHNSWDKNDPKDAQVLLHLLKTGVTQHYHDPLANQIHDFQELSLTYAQISLEKTRTQHRLLTHSLPLYFPEIERYYHATRSEWLLAFLHVFPTPALIARLSMEDFVQQAWTVVGRKVSKQRLLEDIYRTAQSSIGIPVDMDSEAVAMFRVVLGEMIRLCQVAYAGALRVHHHRLPGPSRLACGLSLYIRSPHRMKQSLYLGPGGYSRNHHLAIPLLLAGCAGSRRRPRSGQDDCRTAQGVYERRDPHGET